MPDNIKLVEKNWQRYKSEVLDPFLSSQIDDETTESFLYDFAETIFYGAASMTHRDIAGAHACPNSHLEPVLESLERELQHYSAAEAVHEAHP